MQCIIRSFEQSESEGQVGLCPT